MCYALLIIRSGIKGGDYPVLPTFGYCLSGCPEISIMALTERELQRQGWRKHALELCTDIQQSEPYEEGTTGTSVGPVPQSTYGVFIFPVHRTDLYLLYKKSDGGVLSAIGSISKQIGGSYQSKARSVLLRDQAILQCDADQQVMV